MGRVAGISLEASESSWRAVFDVGRVVERAVLNDRWQNRSESARQGAKPQRGTTCWVGTLAFELIPFSRSDRVISSSNSLARVLTALPP